MNTGASDITRQYIKRIEMQFEASHSFTLAGRLICLAYVGSHSHGTYVAPSDPNAVDDVDLMGVIIPPASYLIGLDAFEHWTLQRDELDVVMYSLHKFVRLLLKGNPNVIGLLWLREEDYLYRTPEFIRLMQARTLFSAKSVYTSFAGYAAGQLHKMTSYSPEIHAEMQTLQSELEAAGWRVSEVMDRRALPMPKGITADTANAKAARLRTLRAKYHAAYMGEKRRALVAQHGYDTKNAAHLIRLLQMCFEFMETGVLNVYRTGESLDMIREIKRGLWRLDVVKEYAELLFADARIARDHSSLPDEPDYDAVNALLIDIVRKEIK